MLGIIGTSMVVASVTGIYRMLPSSQLKQLTKRFFKDIGLDDLKLYRLKQKEYGYDFIVYLPLRIPFSKFEGTKEGLEQACNCGIEYVWDGGKKVLIKYGNIQLRDIMFYDRDREYPELVVPLITPFGEHHIDFKDSSSAHLLVGGATRMGKSAFLQMVTSALLKNTKGKVFIQLISDKITDFYPFRSIPQIKLAETQDECLQAVYDVFAIALQRREFMKANDKVKHDFEHIFLVIDEYARFSDNKEIQERVTWIAETAAYLNIHLIIASQRPDATSVLKPRIKGNMLTRICFKTADEANSKIILDSDIAAKMPTVKGRAILLDGMYHTAHVPYLKTNDIKEYLSEFYKEGEVIELLETGRTSVEAPQLVQSYEPQAIGDIDIPKPKKRKSNRKPSAKKIGT